MSVLLPTVHTTVLVNGEAKLHRLKSCHGGGLRNKPKKKTKNLHVFTELQFTFSTWQFKCYAWLDRR